MAKETKIERSHRHEFLVKFPEATALYAEKRNRPPLAFRGEMRECPGCGAMRFRVPGLREVEVTRC